MQAVGFVGHVNSFRHRAGLCMPVEIAMATVSPLPKKSFVVTVDCSQMGCFGSDVLANRIISKGIHLPEFYHGTFSLEGAKQAVVKKYRALDQGRKLLVAVKGEVNKKFFMDLGLPTVDIETQVVGLCPKLDELPLDLEYFPKQHSVHLKNNYYRCSRRVAWYYARFLERRWKELKKNSGNNNNNVIDLRQYQPKRVVLKDGDRTFTLLLK